MAANTVLALMTALHSLPGLRPIHITLCNSLSTMRSQRIRVALRFFGFPSGLGGTARIRDRLRGVRKAVSGWAAGQAPAAPLARWNCPDPSSGLPRLLPAALRRFTYR